ncbi:MAG TPA: aminopeptidase P family protein [Candidatus Baltobacteraceae bacterium]|jgi:Xaa-Pro aminopeptidase
MDVQRRAGDPAPTQNAYDPETPEALIDFMATGWAERPLAAGKQDEAARYRRRREDLSRAYPGAYLVIPAGEEHVRANDTFFRFRPSSDFAYLMGGGESGGVLVLEPEGTGHRSLLFAREHNRGQAEFFTDRLHGELWVGRHRGVDESQLYFGVDACRPIPAASPYFDELRRAGARVLRIDEDQELAEHLSEMRLIKDEYELGELRKACAITKRGFEDAIRTMRRAQSEREIEAAFWSRARTDANDVGYLTIAAAGEHACTLHWNRNDGTLRPDSLLLLDAGVECDSLYTADITRTLPVGGRFSPEQRAIYELVWDAQRAGIEAVAPGNDFLEPNRRAMRVLAAGLIELGILRGSIDEALDPERQFYRRYSLHNVSHMLGIDVHDCAKARATEYRHGRLREGMVLTVEPGLYFQPDDTTVPERFRGIGVRIEDDIAVTATGWENFSAILPSKSNEVEAWISELWS